VRRSTPSKRIQQITERAISQVQSTYRKTVLPSGLRVVSEKIPAVRSVTIGVWIEVGSRHESLATSGISHFIEHMVFKGTPTRTNREISQSIEAVGGYLNAFTSKEHTCFYVRVLDEFAEFGLDVLSDIVQHPVFPERELEKERGVIIEELKNAEDTPDDIIHEYLEKAMFGNNPLGFPIIGRVENLKRFQKADLTAFHRHHYQPSRMVIAAAGNISHEQLLTLVLKYFPQNGKSKQRVVDKPVKPRRLKATRVEVAKPIQQAHICLGTTAYSIRNKNRYPLLVLNSILGEGMSSRLFQNIREKYGFAYSVYSFVSLLSDSGSFGVYIGTDRHHIDRSIGLINRELEKLVARSVSKGELSRTKAQLKGGMMLSLENIPNRMIRLGSSELYFQELASLDSIIKKIDVVTPDILQEVAKELFVRENFAAVIFKPNGTDAPAPAS